MPARGITQHKFKVLNHKGQILGYVWADDKDNAYDMAGKQHRSKVGTVQPTNIKRTGKPSSDKKEFYKG